MWSNGCVHYLSGGMVRILSQLIFYKIMLYTLISFVNDTLIKLKTVWIILKTKKNFWRRINIGVHLKQTQHGHSIWISEMKMQRQWGLHPTQSHLIYQPIKTHSQSHINSNVGVRLLASSYIYQVPDSVSYEADVKRYRYSPIYLIWFMNHYCFSLSSQSS